MTSCRRRRAAGAYGGEGTNGHVLADVYYDDGTLQDWADETYGARVVGDSALVDVEQAS